METIEKIKEQYEAVYNMSIKPDFKRPKEGDVIDEDQSVRWNKEEVIRLQTKWDEDRQHLIFERRKAVDEIEDKIYKFIQEETGLTEKKAIILWNFIEEKRR